MYINIYTYVNFRQNNPMVKYQQILFLYVDPLTTYSNKCGQSKLKHKCMELSCFTNYFWGCMNCFTHN